MILLPSCYQVTQQKRSEPSSAPITNHQSPNPPLTESPTLPLHPQRFDVVVEGLQFRRRVKPHLVAQELFQFGILC